MHRRDFLKILGATALSANHIEAALASAKPGMFLPARALEERDDVSHIINRLTFGPTPELVAHVREIGVEAFIEEQLNPESIEDSEIEPFLSNLPDLELSPFEILQRYEGMGVQRVFQQIAGNVYIRAVHSKRQLYERMVHFWMDHFSIYVLTGIRIAMKPQDDREVIRQHALGNFGGILQASAHSPAMLHYLDNFESIADAPNENYARELMELHTLGIDGGYTELDVKEVARVFTGWTINNPRLRQGGEPLQFRFEPRMHDDGDKTVLGQFIPGGGENEGTRVLEVLARHPSTARFVSTKLVRRFVSDDPPPTLVDKVAQTFTDTGGDIKQVLRYIFHSDEFWSAPPKFKRAQEYVYSVLRGFQFSVEEPELFARSISTLLQTLGHVPNLRDTPDGYPDVQEYWMDGLLMRWNIAIATAHGDILGGRGSLGDFLAANNIPLKAAELLPFMGTYLFGRELTPDEIQILDDFVMTATGEEVEILQDALALLAVAPSYQYR